MSNLYQLIDALYECPKDVVFENGFTNAHSYRGCYDDLAVEPSKNVKVEDMISELEAAVDETFVGYKGGDFQMTGDVNVYLSNYGCNSGLLLNGWGVTDKGYVLLTSDDE